jgi:amino acid transporter
LITAAKTTPGLSRSLRQWDVVGVVLNGVIGAGIFGLPSRIFGLAGDYSLVAFCLCAVCVAIIVLCFAEVASRYSGTGGPYLYAHETYGPVTGFTVGWLVWLARVTSFAANCSLLPDYLGFFFPAAASGLPRALIMVTVLVVLAAVNLRGVRLMADASNTLAIGKLLPLAVFIVTGMFFLDRSRFALNVLPSYHSFAQSLLLLVYAFTGFEMAVIPAGEIREPGRNLPKALLIGMLIVVAIYVSVQAVCIGTLPGLADSHRPLADAAARFMGTGGAILVTIGIVISLSGNLNVLILASSRVLYAMGESKELPRGFGVVHSRFHTPFTAILTTSTIMLGLMLSGTFIYLVTLSTIARLVTYFVTCSALPVLRRRSGAPAAGYLAPAGTAVALLAMALCVWLLTNISLKEARDAAIAIWIGLTIYFLNQRMLRRSDAS